MSHFAGRCAVRVPRRRLREGRDGALGGRRCARPCSLHRQRGAPISGSSCSPDFCRAFWGTGGATEKSARPWRMRAHRADPRRFCARLLQMRAAQRRAGITPQKSGLSATWKSVKQKSVSLSTAESEWYAGSEAGKELLYLRIIMREFGFPPLGPMRTHVQLSRWQKIQAIKGGATHRYT